jgi:DNA-binding response OmpR family regulator
MILLLSANWPQRSLLRAQLGEETGQEVVGVDTIEEALRWLATTRFDLVVLDTQGLVPNERLLSGLRARRAPVLVVTGPYDQPHWSSRWSNLDVRALLVRPVFIGQVARAARTALETDHPKHRGRSRFG